MSRETIRDRIQRVHAQRERERETKTAVTKWGSERRRKITIAMTSKRNYMGARLEVIGYVRRNRGGSSLTHFFDKIATEEDMQHIEKLLGL